MNISIGKGDVEESVKLYSPSGLLFTTKQEEIRFFKKQDLLLEVYLIILDTETSDICFEPISSKHAFN